MGKEDAGWVVEKGVVVIYSAGPEGRGGEEDGRWDG